MIDGRERASVMPGHGSSDGCQGVHERSIRPTLGNIASARGVELHGVRCRVEGDIDLRGILGIDEGVRNGFQDIRVVFEVDGDAEAEKLASLVDQSRARSAVFDVLTHGTQVSVEVERS